MISSDDLMMTLITAALTMKNALIVALMIRNVNKVAINPLSVTVVIIISAALVLFLPSGSRSDNLTLTTNNMTDSKGKHLDEYVSHGLFKGPGGSEKAKNFITPSVTGDNTTFIAASSNNSDIFGILQIYPTLPGGEVWLF